MNGPRSKPRGDETRLPPPAAPTGRRLWFFRFLLLAAPFLLLLVVEVLLRLLGVGHPTSAILCRQEGSQRICRENPDFGKLVFAPSLARTFTPFRFAETKPPRTMRIFIIGESAAQGYPDSSIAFGRILEVMLRTRHPTLNFEVVTVAMSAIDSQVFPAMAEDCARYNPDLFIVYAGNNEVIGPYGPRSAPNFLVGHRSAIRLHLALKRTRLAQTLAVLRERWTMRNDRRPTWRGMAMFTNSVIRASDPDLTVVYDHFQRNLEDVRDQALAHGAKVIFSTVGSNLKDCPPFVSLHRLDLSADALSRWQVAFDQGVAAEAETNRASAIEAYRVADGIDPDYSELQFRLGRCLLASGAEEEARERFIKARDLDALRFRADSRDNAVVARVAADGPPTSVALVDAAEVLASGAPSGIPGEELFLEHVHMGFRANYLLARAILKPLEEFQLPVLQSLQPAAPVPDMDTCAAVLAHTGWEARTLMASLYGGMINKAPFTAQLDHAQYVTEMEQRIRAIDAQCTPEMLKSWDQQYRRSLAARPGDMWLNYKLGSFLLDRLNQPEQAAPYLRQALAQAPQWADALAKLGLVLGRLGDVSGAIAHCREALRLSAGDRQSLYHLGVAYQLMADRKDSESGRWNKLAVAQYREALAWDRSFLPARNNLAGILNKEGRFDEAIAVMRGGLLDWPDDAELHYRLGLVLRNAKRDTEAMEMFLKASQLNPKHAVARTALTNLEQSVTTSTDGK
jgi:tetratricopeptide (TPR) repeat protein